MSLKIPQGAVTPTITEKIEHMRPGISFRNPEFTGPATIVKDYPWLMMRWSTPFSMVREGTPHNDMLNMKTLNVRRPYWRREAKNGILRRLNHGSREVSNYGEIGLGQVPDSGKDIPTQARDPLGFLSSLLKQAGGVWQTMEQQKTKRSVAIAEAKAQTEIARIQQPSSLAPNNTMLIVGGLGLISAVIIFTAKPKVR